MAPSIVLALFLLCAVAFAKPSQSNSTCPLLGPDVPAPIALSTNSKFKATLSNLKNSLDSAIRQGSDFGNLTSSNTSFSLDVYSIHSVSPLFTYHHSASGLAKPRDGVSSVNSDTVYRIGSVSKLWTIYIYLIEAGDTSFNHPVTEYVPELAAYDAKNKAQLDTNGIDTFSWSDITVGALASQLAGVPRDAAPGPASNKMISQFSQLPLAASPNVSFCGDPAIAQFPCDRADFFADYLIRPPVLAPFSASPVYSNSAYQILAYALENITSQSFPDLFDKLAGKLNLTSSTYSEPASNQSSIIPSVDGGAGWYSANLRDETPAGGFYSTINDLRKLGTSILNSTFLTSAQTRRWMKPTSFTSDANDAVGAPWEIFRAPGSRTSFIYSKSGDVVVYSSLMALLPDYDVGFTILAAGLAPDGNVEIVANIVTQFIYPALEAAAKAEAKSTYAGIYRIPGSSNSSLTISTDSEPGLTISEWTFEGADVFQILGELYGVMAGSQLSMRLFPSGLKNTENGRTTATGWRAVVQVLPKSVDPGAFSYSCYTWATLDSLVYGIYSLDLFVFTFNEDGTVTGIEPKVLQGVSYSKSKGQRSRVMRAMSG